MSRPLRIEFPDALYHLTSRGNRREPIFLDDADRLAFLAVLAQCCERMDAAVYAYCLMGNHYHLVLTTRRANLSALMRHLNGVYTQAVNRRHGKVGHVFQGRFKAILVDRDAYFLALCPYVELNPVRAGMVSAPQQWPWSSYSAHVGIAPAPPWLDIGAVQAAMLGAPAATAAQRRSAARRYADLVNQASQKSIWDDGLRKQVFLGDDAFVERSLKRASATSLRSSSVPRAQRSRPIPLSHWLKVCATREEAFYRAHVESGMTMTAIGAEVGLTIGRISQLIRVAKDQLA
jgi:REP element-mobilizing transposase RayT